MTQKLTAAQRVTLYLGIYDDQAENKALVQTHTSLQSEEFSELLKVIPVTLVSG